MSESQLLLDRVYHWEKTAPNQLYMTQPCGAAPVQEFTWKRTMDEARRMASYIAAQNLPAGSRIGVHDDFKGQIPRALVVVKSGVDVEADGDRIRKELVDRVRSEVGAVASLRQVDIVAALPKTRSGKILRKTMREIADGHTPAVPATIEDAGVLDRLAPVLRPHG